MDNPQRTPNTKMFFFFFSFGKKRKVLLWNLFTDMDGDRHFIFPSKKNYHKKEMLLLKIQSGLA